ncbi:hypothetical protein HAINFHK1212_1676 [Haemophilus influenzae HK1212]|uniref:Uncharacterized protein n=1 Tax=Haemophilus influenzae HK1212 TaxID=456482 RepID=A0A7G2JYK8_HAEIF|nr:hypothetical protein HAINFHK1212_1676 [Haemophilus influenzae HK1212]
MKKLTTKPFTRRTLAYLLILAFYTSWGYAVEEDEFYGKFYKYVSPIIELAAVCIGEK